MDDRRIKLHNILLSILGTNNVYYQPPENTHISYPAIIYSRNDIENKFANNNVYTQFNSYMITVIDRSPDSDVVRKISKLKQCSFSRHFVFDGLNHDVFVIYF